MSQKDIVEKVRGQFVYLDLVSGECLVSAAQADANRPLALRSADGKAAVTLPLLPEPLRKGNRGVFLRDGAGGTWLGHWRCDGNAWQPVLPPNGFEFAGDMRGEILQGRLRYDERKQAWFDAWPWVPTDVSAYEPNSRTGWITRYGKYREPFVSEKYEFSPDGNRRLQATLTAKAGPEVRELPVPHFELGGDVWLRGVFRWDGRSAHYYDNGWQRRVNDREWYPAVLRSPKGNVWMLHRLRTWHRYDPAADRFVEAEPFDEFCFQAAGRTFAVIGWPTGDALGLLHEKVGGVWTPVENPFARKRGVTYSLDPPANRFQGISDRLLRNGRLIVTCLEGALEYDLETRRWAYLAPQTGLWAFFDEKGRRVMVSENHKGTILMYEGDPIARDAASRPENDLEATLRRLLVGMDSDSWRKREEATAEAINLMRKNPRAVAAILERTDLAKTYSPEVKARVDLVLLEKPEGEAPPDPFGSLEGQQVALRRALGNSLLERMHPPMAARVRYVVETGMEYEHAQAVFQAAGALYSAEILNAHHPDLSFQGYLLPDGTMAYIRVETGDRMGKVVSLGLGEAGKGHDKHWEWDDKKRNSLKSLELKPYRTRVLD